MKKNIQVNLSGCVYNIDEDAYQLLDCYLRNLRSYFSRQEDGVEIVDDIEARVSELIGEMTDGGREAVNIETIREIIDRVGEPDELCDVTADDKAAADNPEVGKPKRKLFRDVDHKMLGGVLAGLGCYLGVNPLWLRLLFVVLAWASFGFMLLVYIVCWIGIPAAVTPAERLEMKGDPVTAGSIKDEILARAQAVKTSVGQSGAESFFSSVMGFVCSVFKIFLFATGIAIVIGTAVMLIITIIGGCLVLITPLSEVSWLVDSDLPLLQFSGVCPPVLYWSATVSLILFLALTLYLCAYLLMRFGGKCSPMSRYMKVISVTTWFVALIVFTVTTIRMVNLCTSRVVKVSVATAVDDNDADGYGLLSSQGWRVIKANNVEDELVDEGEHYSGNRNSWYIDAESEDGLMELDIARDVKVAPGRYTLEAVARADGNGCEIYAVNSAGQRFTAPVPVCGEKGGSVWADAKAALANDSTPQAAREHLLKLSRVNNGKGYGWSRVTIDNVVVGADSILSYGVSNTGQTRLWDGTHLSATSFSLLPAD